MTTITINPHHCSKEEFQELTSYLETNCWNFTINEPQKVPVLKHDYSEDFTTNEKYNMEATLRAKVANRFHSSSEHISEGDTVYLDGGQTICIDYYHDKKEYPFYAYMTIDLNTKLVLPKTFWIKNA